MLNKAINSLQKKSYTPLKGILVQAQSMSFSAGPYNPLAYKAKLVPEELPS